MDILTHIVEYKKEEIAAARKRMPESVLRTNARQYQSNRAFGQKLATPDHTGVNIIAEIKRASPSKGIICADLDAARQANAYEKGGAAALSVLTDRQFFNGSPADLAGNGDGVVEGLGPNPVRQLHEICNNQFFKVRFHLDHNNQVCLAGVDVLAHGTDDEFPSRNTVRFKRDRENMADLSVFIDGVKWQTECHQPGFN